MISPQKIIILYILTKSDVGGAQKYVADLAANLDKNRFEAKIFYGGRDIRWLSNHVYPFLLFLNDWLAIIELAKLFRRERPDVIHLNSSKAGVLGSIAASIHNHLQATSYKLQAKVIFTAHGWVFNPTNALFPPVRWFYVLLHKFAALFEDMIINVSEYDQRIALRYRIAPPRKLVTVHNGIDLNMRFLDREAAREEILKRLLKSSPLPTTSYKLQASCPWIGSIGRLTKEKDYLTFIKAAAEIPRAYFFIIGEGTLRTHLIKRIGRFHLEKRFFIIPPTNQDGILLKAFDIFVMTSRKEGLPYVLLEAMTAELPVVTTRVGGIPEVIADGENGLLTALRSPHETAEAIVYLIDNRTDPHRLAEQGKKTIALSFTLEQMVSLTQNLYRQALARENL